MTIYYWESELKSGQFEAISDIAALNIIEKDVTLLYKESNNSSTGIPFVVLYERKKVENFYDLN